MNESSLVHYTACPNPFATTRFDGWAPAGTSLAHIVRTALPHGARGHLHLLLGDQLIPMERWDAIRPTAGDQVLIRVVPDGDMGDVLGSVLRIAVFVASLYFAPQLGLMLGELTGLSTAALWAGGPSLATLAAGGILTTLGTMAVNALIPPVQSSLDHRLERLPQSFAIAGSANDMRPYGVVPILLGRVRYTPPKAALDFSESVGELQHVRCLFDFGPGPLQLSEMRIGSTPLEQFQGVEVEVRQGWPDDPPLTLYTNTVMEDGYSILLSHAGGAKIVESRDDADELLLDITWAGLVKWSSTQSGGGRSGPLQNISSRTQRSVTIRIEWRPVTRPTWSLLTEEAVKGSSEQPYRKGWRIITGTPSRCQVRVTRITADSTDISVRDTCYLTALRTVRYDRPVRATEHCLVALRIQATDQLNGTVSQFSAVAQRVYRVWTGSDWVWQPSRNPAWAWLYVLTGNGNGRPTPDSRVHLDELKSWADACDITTVDGGPRHTYDGAIDSPSTLFHVLRDIAGSARASLSVSDGLYTVVRDVAQSIPVQLFTPRNSWGFRGVRRMPAKPHGLRVRYVEPDRDWTLQEVVVYADGYSEANATRLEVVEMLGCTRRVQAWREGRYHLAVMRLRPESYELCVDVEHLVCTRGDLVRVSHDVTLFGIAAARITALALDGAGKIASVSLDEEVPTEPDKSYAMRVRTPTGQSLHPVTLQLRTAQLLLPVAQGSLSVGDLVAIGETERESVAMLVKEIYPGPDLSARLVLIDAAPAVHLADIGMPPSWVPHATSVVPYKPPAPVAPVVEAVCSDERAAVKMPDGSLLPRIVLRLAPRSGSAVADMIEVGYRRTQERWRACPTLPQGEQEVMIAHVEEGERYDIRLRAISPDGALSAWCIITDHTVVGRSTLPPAPSLILVDHLPNNGIRYRILGDLPADFAGYEVRWHVGTSGAWDAATLLYPGLLPSGSWESVSAPAPLYTVLAKMVDSAGHRSADPAWTVVSASGTSSGHVVQTVDFGNLGWIGSVAGGCLRDGSLIANTSSLLFADPSQPVCTNPDAPVIDRWSELSYNTVFTATRSGFLCLAWQIDGPSPSVLVRLPGTDRVTSNPLLPLFTDPDALVVTDRPYAHYHGPSAVLAGENVELWVTVPEGNFEGKITTLVATVEIPVTAERQIGVSVAATGSRLAATRFAEVLTVALSVTPVAGSSAIHAMLLDKSPGGPLVQCYDASGSATAGVVDATLYGLAA
ncbi:MAG: host specificity factor TipJ family phage tail protein [Magnetococcus sp. MYC-9]